MYASYFGILRIRVQNAGLPPPFFSEKKEPGAMPRFTRLRPRENLRNWIHINIEIANKTYTALYP